MNSKPVVALQHVERDLKQAIAHYESWRRDGKRHVLGLYDETIRWIEWNPDLFPRKFGRVQRAIIKRSYFIVYFVQESDKTVVLAVMDGRRDPSDIRTTLRTRRASQ